MSSSSLRRIRADIRELLMDPSPRYHAAPLDDDMFEWHFTIRGPEDTDFAGGIYHGRILLPAEYPFKPPNIVFLTPSGRFEINVKVCLSFTAHHAELWQPAWGIRLILEALISFLPTPADGALGSLNWSSDERKKLAIKSKDFICQRCGKCKNLLPDHHVIDKKPADEEASAAAASTKKGMFDNEIAKLHMLQHMHHHQDGNNEQEEDHKNNNQVIAAGGSSTDDNQINNNTINDIQHVDNNTTQSTNDDVHVVDNSGEELLNNNNNNNQVHDDGGEEEVNDNNKKKQGGGKVKDESVANYPYFDSCNYLGKEEETKEQQENEASNKAVIQEEEVANDQEGDDGIKSVITLLVPSWINEKTIDFFIFVCALAVAGLFRKIFMLWNALENLKYDMESK